MTEVHGMNLKFNNIQLYMKCNYSVKVDRKKYSLL